MGQPCILYSLIKSNPIYIMPTQNYLPYAHQTISAEDMEEVRIALSQPVITRGPLVEGFEKAFAEYCQVSYAVAFNSGTSALMAAYFAADIGVHDRVLTTPNSFVASIGPGIQRGATPVFIDIDFATGNLNLEHLVYNINQPKSKGKTAVVPVHYAGIPVDIEAIDASITNPSTMIIEDASHALGSQYKNGSKVGSCEFSQMTVFSFHPAKTITSGEGGMVTTNDAQLAHRLRLFRNNGIERDAQYMQGQPAPWYYEVVALSGNYNFTDIQAALGLSQLKRLDTIISKRQGLLQKYKQLLNHVEPVRLLSYPEELTLCPHLCVVHIDFESCHTSRTEVMNALHAQGIGTQLHYIPIYRHPFFVETAGDISEYFPEMEKHYEQALSLPYYADLDEADVDRVVRALKGALGL